MIKGSKIINSKGIRRAQLAVGIPSFNEGDNIDFVVNQIDRGLERYFKGIRAVIINVDNNSSDNTKKVFLTTKTRAAKIYVSTPKLLRGKGYNLYNFFSQIKLLRTEAAAVVDADLKSIRPEWIASLLRPILKSYDYITPRYYRGQHDGSITNQLCYPVVYGVLGRNIRQPIGGDFAFSRRLVEYWLKQKWQKEVFGYGIDIFMTLNAVLGGFKIAQANLGTKRHKPSAPKLGTMFFQVALALFSGLEKAEKKYLKTSFKAKIPILGKAAVFSPPALPFSRRAIKSVVLSGFQKHQGKLKKYLGEKTFLNLEKKYQTGDLDISSRVWCRIIYDFIYSFNSGRSPDLIRALEPLYFARTLSFYEENAAKDFNEYERQIKNQAKLFRRNKDYLRRKYSR